VQQSDRNKAHKGAFEKTTNLAVTAKKDILWRHVTMNNFMLVEMR